MPFALLPIRKISSLLPTDIQHGVVRFCTWVVKGVSIINPLSISYRSYKVFLSGSERGGAEIYFFYLLYGKWKHELYEQSVVEHVLHLGDRPHVIDVGASYGMYSLLAASIPNVEHVIAIEASPRTCRFVRETIEFNHLEQRIQLLNLAASGESGAMFDVVEMINSEWNKVSVATSVGSETIKSIAIDDLIGNIPSTSLIFIKMDIEGHEAEALRGMRHLLETRRRFILMFEFHVGLMRDRAFDFAEALFQIPASCLYLMDAGKRTLLELTPPMVDILIENAKKAEHPFNLYNLLLIDESLVYLLPTSEGQH